MNSVFKLSRSGITDLVVTGLELDNGEYLDENLSTLISIRNYAFSHSVTVNVLSYVTLSGTTIADSVVVQHVEGCNDESIFKMGNDGLYEVSHLIIPNKKWYDYCYSFGDQSSLSEYKEIYFYDEETSKIMKVVGQDISECTVQDLMDANSSDKVYPTDEITTVIKGEKSTFNTYYLRKCHSDLCQNLLNLKLTTCQVSTDLKQQLYIRDILFMALTSIKFAIDTYQFYEAQRILESIQSCGVICKKDKIYNNNCNCN